MSTTQPSTSRRPRRRRGLPPIPWKRLIAAVGVFLVIGALFLHYGDIHAVHRAAGELNAGVAFALLVFLPLIGFPASVLHVAAGIRFGAPLGLALVALSILLQLLASYGIVQLWRDRFDRSRWLKQIRERLPEGSHASVCALAVLLPGVPYAATNYTLPLIGVPLRTFLLCALPLHVLRSSITVVFGDQSDQLTGPRLAVLAVYALLIAGASTWAYRRLRSQLGDPRPAADGRKQPA